MKRRPSTIVDHTLFVRDTAGDYRIAPADVVLARARCLLGEGLPGRSVIESPQAARDWFLLHLAPLEHEVFAVVFLNNQHRIIGFEELFRGTIDGASVHAREVVKACLFKNAAAVILGHNHPSGVVEPSEADRHITTRLKQALALVDIRVLDHFVVGGSAAYSFAEHGLI